MYLIQILLIIILIILIEQNYNIIGFIFLILIGVVMFLSKNKLKNTDAKFCGGDEQDEKYSQSKQLRDDYSEENPDFIDAKYDEKIDDQRHLTIKMEEQTYLYKSYEKMVEYAFPKISEESDIPEKYKGMEPEEINLAINREILEGKDQFWTNRSLSYMRKDVQGKRLVKCVFLPVINKILGEDAEISFVDTTANIGGTSLQYALLPRVRSIKSYDLDPSAIKMLKNNVELYGYGDKFTILNKRFDGEIPKDAVISIDPPFELSNNIGNFNLSIENKPIYFVVEDVLNAEASVVFLEMPAEFRYNSRFAKDHHQFVSVYLLPTKNIKIYAISKHPAVGNFDRYYVVRNHLDDSIYSCKIILTRSMGKKRSYFKKFQK